MKKRHYNRKRLVRSWEQYVLADGAVRETPADLRPVIATSWQRSAASVPLEVLRAPLADPAEIEACWEATPLRTAVSRIEAELRGAAQDGGLVVAVTDPTARIMWTCGGTVMRRRAEGVNFVPGGCWDESSVGTNALDLALRLNAPSTVYSAEHFTACVHDWICWAAPIHDPASGRQLGVLDLSTTWDRAHPMGSSTAAAFARLLEQALPEGPSAAPGALELRVLGAGEASLDGVRLVLSRRQLEVLTLLALHPAGLTLDALHAHLYGDRPVSPVTLKAELSHLRRALGGAIAIRRYRLTLPVRCDAVEVIELLRANRVGEAVERYQGELLAGTEAPGLLEHANFLSVAVREALVEHPDPQAVLRYADLVPYDVEVLEHAIRAIGGTGHPAAALLRARLRGANAV
jgi:transcriptional regulator of acetoin/glycerol metabolism